MRNNDKRPDNSQRVEKPEKIKEASYIHRQKVWIDTEIVNMNCGHGNNYTEYGLFHDTRQPDDIHDTDSNTEGIWKNTNHACFAGLLNKLYKKDDEYNRMFYTVYLKKPDDKNKSCYNPDANILLSIEECIRWIQLTKEHKLLPDYVDENMIEMLESPIALGNTAYSYSSHIAVGKGTAVLDLTGLTQAQLYLYLATLRNLREDTGFVRTTIYFVDRCKMNFYAAYVLASRIAITTIGHHTITVCRNYSTALQVIDPKTGKRKKVKTKLSSIEAITADMIWMMGLQRLAENPKKHDKYLAHQCTHSFSCASLISKISNIHAEINIYEALDPDIVKAIMATDDTTSQKYVTEFLEKRPRIKYKRAPKKKEATGEE